MSFFIVNLSIITTLVAILFESMKTTLALVSTHSLWSDCLTFALRLQPGIEVSNRFDSCEEFIAHVETQRSIADIILMECAHYLEQSKFRDWLRTENPDSKIVLLSRNGHEVRHEDMHTEVVNIPHGEGVSELLREIRKHRLGKSPALMAAQPEEMHKPLTDPVNLKDRELEFLKWACTELTYKDIALKMFLSPKTIDGYRESLFQKLQVRTRIGLVRYAVKHGILYL